ncbi:MAG TPA: VOC family protein [Actinomycetota bacterium]|nr:VOC family protein [Actinomycetota bacterium]
MSPPELSGVLETVLYYTDEDETRRFYCDVMGMNLIGQTLGRQIFLRAGTSVFLLFNAEATQKPGSLPPHGATGPGHVCFLVPMSAYAPWRDRLMEAGVEILEEVDWPPGQSGKPPLGSSFYFRDPSGNLLEIANADFWGR